MNLGGPPRRASEPTRRPASGHVHDNESVAETQQSGETNAASGDATEEDDNQTQASAASVPALNEGTRLTVLAGLACVFLIAATFSARNWSKYERSRVAYLWDKRACTIVSSAVRENPNNPGMYRVEANVTQVKGISKENTTRTAYYGRSAAFHLTREAAEGHNAGIKPGNGLCWVKVSDTARISLQPVDAEKEIPRGALYVAWITTFIASITGVLTLTLSSHWLNACVAARLSNQGRPEHGVTPPQDVAKRRAVLSSEQVRHLSAVCADIVKQGDLAVKDWTCSICLEDNDEDVLRTVLLPCQHRFHNECIKKWLRRGKAACPLCNWDARTLFKNSEGPPIEKSEVAHTHDAVGTGQGDRNSM